MQVRAVDIKVGYSCNNNCIHCVITGNRERLCKEKKPVDRTTSEIKRLVLDAAKKGAESVTFTGGEATIRKDFFELLKYAAGSIPAIQLQTNGRAFAVPRFAEKALSIAPSLEFVVALHHTKAEVHDGITRAKGSWKQTTRGIENIKREGGRVSLKVVLSRLNYENLPELVMLAERMGVKDLPVAFPHGMGNALKYWRKVVPTYSEIKPNLLEAARFADGNGANLSYEAVPFCFLGGCENRVSELKYLQEWADNRITEVNQVGDPAIDWQKERLAIKRKAEKCKKCRYFYICEGVWEEYFGFYGPGEFKPVAGKKIRTWIDLQKVLKI